MEERFVFPWGDSDHRLEGSAEVALIPKAGFRSDRGHRERPRPQGRCRLLHLRREDVLAERGPVVPTEHACNVHRMDADPRAYRGNARPVAAAAAANLDDAPQPGGSRAAYASHLELEVTDDAEAGFLDERCTQLAAQVAGGQDMSGADGSGRSSATGNCNALSGSSTTEPSIEIAR